MAHLVTLSVFSFLDQRTLDQRTLKTGIRWVPVFRPLNVENGHIGPAKRVYYIFIFKILWAAANATLKIGTHRVPVFRPMNISSWHLD